MNLASKLWNVALDKILEHYTGHKFDRRTGICNLCRAYCEDVMEEFKKSGKDTSKCPHQEKNQS